MSRRFRTPTAGHDLHETTPRPRTSERLATHRMLASPGRVVSLALAASLLGGAVAVAAEATLDDAPAPAAVEVVEVRAASVGPVTELPDVDDLNEAMQADVAAGIAAVAPTVWDRLADCESGNWSKGRPMLGSRRWDYGLTFDHGDIFEGGLNFHPRTWDAFRDSDMPSHAGKASREQQIVVGERVLDEQGWGAWPVCSRKLGLR